MSIGLLPSLDWLWLTYPVAITETLVLQSLLLHMLMESLANLRAVTTNAISSPQFSTLQSLKPLNGDQSLPWEETQLQIKRKLLWLEIMLYRFEFCFSCQHYGMAEGTTSEAVTALEESCLPLCRHKSFSLCASDLGLASFEEQRQALLQVFVLASKCSTDTCKCHSASGSAAHASWPPDFSKPTTEVRGIPGIIMLGTCTGFAGSETQIVDF